MAFNPFRKIRVPPNAEITEKEINAVQDNIAEAFQQLLGKDQLDSRLITNITLFPSTVNKVPHTLGRRLNGWFVVRTHGGYNAVFDAQDTNPSQDLFLYLQTPAQVKVDLLVF